MNENFQSLYRSLINEEINGTEFLEGLKLIGDFREDLLQVLTEHRSQQDAERFIRTRLTAASRGTGPYSSLSAEAKQTAGTSII